MIGRIVRRWRRRAVLKAWSRGELEFAGAVARRPHRRKLFI